MQISPIDAASLVPTSPLAQSVEAELTRIFPSRSVRRILFVAPPDGNMASFNYSTCKLGRYPNFPPYGTGILATRLRNEGFEVDILNLNSAVLRACRQSRSEEEFDFAGVVTSQLASKLESFRPDLVGITCMFSQIHTSAITVCNQIKKMRPDVPLMLGGVHVTNSTMDEKTCGIFLKDFPGVDFFFLYESDLTFPAFLRVVNRKAPVSELAQVIFNGPGMKLNFTNRRTPTEEDLNVIPAHDLITEPDLAENGKIGSYHCFLKPGTRFSTVLSNRGCRAQCTFCSVRNFNGMGVRHRSVQSIIDELLMLRNEHGVGHIMWLDDDLLKDHKRALQLFNEMIRQKVGITWDCTNGVIAFSCTEELMPAAMESGCLGLNIGMESGNPEILREIRKPGTVEVFLKAAEVLNQCEQIHTRAFLMLGFPHETYRMIQDTINVAEKMNLDWYNITPLQPLPNTPIFGQMAMEGLVGSVTFDEIRYGAGAYGKFRKSAEKKVNVLATDFKGVFEEANLDSIPSRSEVNRIWAYMNYHLNFGRLLKEKRPIKRWQAYKYLEYIADAVAPDDAFAQYFRGYLHWKVYGRIESHLVEHLRTSLAGEPLWQDRLDDFHLSVNDLVTGRFPDGETTGKGSLETAAHGVGVKG